MGLRFHKSFQILPGVRLNLNKNSISVSTGIKGFRKTFSTNGKVTTSVGIPGTGLYYTDTKKIGGDKKKKEKEPAKSRRKATAPQPQQPVFDPALAPAAPAVSFEEPAPAARQARQVSTAEICTIHKTVDDSIDWKVMAQFAEPPVPGCNEEMWHFYHSVAPQVLAGDIDTYLSLIEEVSPLDDLLEFGSGFTFGTDDPTSIEVEFEVLEDALKTAKKTMTYLDFQLLLQDFVCSTTIRAARDMLALLPVKQVVVHAVLDGDTVLSAAFDRAQMDKIPFEEIDPSDTVEKFRHEMKFTAEDGFAPVKRLS